MFSHNEAYVAFAVVTSYLTALYSVRKSLCLSICVSVSLNGSRGEGAGAKSAILDCLVRSVRFVGLSFIITY